MSSPLYYLVRPVARYVLSYYFRNIQIDGLENIPKTGAVILAANHPTAFLEPCMLACFQPRPLHFLARGDLYKNALATFILKALNILPVYRLKDGGFKKLRNNFDTFAACHAALSKRKAIMILAEGNCIHEKNLRPLQKGTARVALGALDADATLPEVYVVPVGVNFTDASKVRTEVMIRCGEPILASSYLTEYRASPSTALSNLTLHLRQRLNPLVVQFAGPAVKDIGEVLLSTYRSLNIDQHLDLSEETRIAAGADLAMSEALRLQASLSVTNIELGAVAGARRGVKSEDLLKRPTAGILIGLLALIIQLPSLAVWLISQWIAETRSNFIEFFSPVRFAAIAITTLIFTVLSLLFLPWVGKAWVLLALITVRPCIQQWERLNRWKAQKDWERAVPEDRKQLETHFTNVRNIITEIQSKSLS